MLTQERLDPKLRRHLDEYLARVSEALVRSKTSAQDVQNIREDIESQFYILLAQRACDPPTEDDVFAVLAEFDDPQDYGDHHEIKPAQRFSRLTIVGACWAPFFLLAIALLFLSPVLRSVPGASSRVWWEKFLVYTAFSLGAAAPFGTTILGWIALTQIRYSGGRLVGLGLAFVNAILFPLLLLDVLIYLFLGASLQFGMLELHHFYPSREYRPIAMSFGYIYVAIGLILICLADFLIAKRVWKAISLTAS